MDALTWLCLLGTPITVMAAARRSRFLAVFTAIVLGIQSLVAAAVGPALPLPAWLVVALQALVYAYFLSVARSLPEAVRLCIGLPAMVWAGGTLLAIPWAVADAVGHPWGMTWVPFVVAGFGALQSYVPRMGTVDVALDGVDVPRERRYRRGRARVERPLRIVQISDPHLGPFMSERRLRRICERAVARQPDLILLTGDFLTISTNRIRNDDAGATPLGRALAPLRAYEGRTFACRGNHDLEAPQHVARGLAEAGVRLLIDEAVTVPTPAGPVQLVGADFRWRGVREHLAALDERFPRGRDGALRLWLLHNPAHFRRLPRDAADLVLSGHTHGGQLGLVAFGRGPTLVSLFGRIPDHGLWARGRMRLYVHRGTGHYGFPVRAGVPAEQSLLRVHRPAPALEATG